MLCRFKPYPTHKWHFNTERGRDWSTGGVKLFAKSLPATHARKKRKKASTQSVINIVLTLIPSHCDNWWALLLRSELPALVTNRAGTWKLPLSSVKSSNASCAEGNSFFPRTITPSMSNRKPNRQFGNNWKRNMYVFWILNFYQGSSFTTKTYIHVTILNYFVHDTVQKIIKIYLVFSGGGGGGENTWKCNKYPQNGLVEKEAHHLRQLVQWHLILNEQHDSPINCAMWLIFPEWDNEVLHTCVMFVLLPCQPVALQCHEEEEICTCNEQANLFGVCYPHYANLALSCRTCILYTILSIYCCSCSCFRHCSFFLLSLMMLLLLSRSLSDRSSSLYLL